MLTFIQFVNNLGTYVIDPIIYIIVLLSILFMVWGVVVMLKNSDNDEAISTGKRHLLWGAIGFSISVLAVQIVPFLKSIF